MQGSTNTPALDQGLSEQELKIKQIAETIELALENLREYERLIRQNTAMVQSALTEVRKTQWLCRFRG